jgi:phosphohistidine phosphatase SixA
VIEQSTALTLDPKDIARAELARWLRRLGPLTSEQEEKIESVLMSIALRTSQLATNVMDSLLRARSTDST